MNSQQTLKPLSGLRVLDFTMLPPGGACSVMLADLGAEVIRVEPPKLKGKPSLVIGQVALSRGKRSLSLDMRNPDAVGVLKRLAPTVDIVVENAKPGAMEQCGFGFSQCRQINPGIIWCAITGFGQTGPYAQYAAHDLSFMAHSGLLSAVTQSLSWQPNISIALQAGALSAVVAIQSALIQRMRSGEGAFIDQSLSEAATWFLNGGINPLSDSPFALRASADRRLYQCADDRYVAVACAEPRTWKALCEGLGLPRLLPLLHKPEHDAEATEVLASAFKTRPAIEWVKTLAPAGAAVILLNHGSQLLDDPQVQARQSVAMVDGQPVPATPVRVAAHDGATTGTAMAAPHKVGDDSSDILAAAGYSDDEIVSLEQAGLI